MSDRNPPARRRRIAGETAKPSVRPAGKPVVKKPVPGRNPARAAEPVTEPAAPQVKVPRPQMRSSRERSADGGLREVMILVLAAVVLAGGVVTAALGFKHWQGESFADSRAAATTAASDAVETILSYRYDKLDEHRRAVEPLMTNQYFDDEYVKVTEPALKQLAPQRKVTVKAVVRDAAPVPCGERCSASKAQVLLFVDLDRRAEGEDDVTVFANRLLVDLVKSDGGWKVSNVKGL